MSQFVGPIIEGLRWKQDLSWPWCQLRTWTVVLSISAKWLRLGRWLQAYSQLWHEGFIYKFK